MTMRKLMLFASAAVVSTAVMAVDFPLRTGDFSTAADWGGQLPGTTDLAQFVYAGPYTATNDVTLGRIRIKANNCVFDQRNSTATVNLTASSAGNTATFDFETRDFTATIRGGKWNSSGTGCFGASYKAGDTLIITNEAEVTIAGTLMPGFQSDRGKVIITGGSKVTAQTLHVGYTSSSSTLEVNGGSTLEVNDQAYTENQSNRTGNKIILRGAGTKYIGKSGKNLQIGWASSGAGLYMSDGADLQCGSLYVGSYSGSTYGHDATVAADESTISVESNFYVGRNVWNNTASFTNTSVSVGAEFGVGCFSVNATNNAVRFIGPRSTLSYRSHQDVPFFGTGSCNLISFEDGASHSLAQTDVSLSVSAHDNRIVLKNGGALLQTGGKQYLSATNSANFATSYANAIEIGENATNQFYNMYVNSLDSRVVVSNGVLRSERNDSSGKSLHFGHAWDQETLPSGNLLLLQGGHPLVSLQNSGVEFKNASRLRFEIPAEGYAEAPVQARTFSLSDDSVLEVECASLVTDEPTKTKKYCLIDCSNANGLSIPDAVLAAAQASLPARCTLYVADGKQLMLKVAGNYGLMLLFR